MEFSGMQKGKVRYKDWLIVLFTLTANMILMSIYFDFYYDLNDDVFIRDIISGRYTGAPDGHNIQTLYILGGGVSLLYKLCRNVPWYGLFLISCQLGCLYLMGVRLLKLCEKKAAKIGCMILLSIFIWGILLIRMVALHYTFVCAVLAATAVFLFMTTPEGMTPEQFIVWNIPSGLLVILAYQLRTEMLLLVFPFICLAGLFRWSREEVFFEKKHFFAYGVVFALIVAGMLLSRLIDFAAYADDEWKEFLDFFNARTEVYDFHVDVLKNEEHKQFLESVGLNDAQRQLLDNYNFGMDERINAELMEKIAEYALDKTDYFASIRQKTVDYIDRTLHTEDAPYNWIVIFLYLCIALQGVAHAISVQKKADGAEKRKTDVKKWAFLWKLILLGTVRSALWMFILVRGRAPGRITDSLYLVETMLLTGMLWEENQKGRLNGKAEKGDSKWEKTGLVMVLFGMLCLYYMPQTVKETTERETSREESHQACAAIDRYCREHPENFYFKDVYATVGSSQKIFQDVDNTLANHDIMGGWLCKSPLYYKKLDAFGIQTMEEGLLYMDSVYFITGQDDGTSWLSAYYAGNGTMVDVEQIDSVDGNFAVYSIKKLGY